MNLKQRNKNRETAKLLSYLAHTCPECGERGKHWVQAPFSIADWSLGGIPRGFWTCAKFYGPDGRRLT